MHFYCRPGFHGQMVHDHHHIQLFTTGNAFPVGVPMGDIPYPAGRNMMPFDAYHLHVSRQVAVMSARVLQMDLPIGPYVFLTAVVHSQAQFRTRLVRRSPVVDLTARAPLRFILRPQQSARFFQGRNQVVRDA
ncbi:hypothetical protein WS68_16490 [Burkholderia sp. TSV86]|nr:hypothetical protein WS68_16490 [Burkholderia sp. TSV86]